MKHFNEKGDAQKSKLKHKKFKTPSGNLKSFLTRFGLRWDAICRPCPVFCLP